MYNIKHNALFSSAQSFAKNMGKNIGKNISKDLSDKYSQKLFDHAKKFATEHLKLLQKDYFKKIAEATGDLVVNKIARVAKKIHNRII